MSEEKIERLHALIDGRVQGVGFRYFVLDKAHALNLTGWVRNINYDQVEVKAEGSREDLEKLLKFLHRGPAAAAVTSVDFSFENATGEFDHFTVAFDS